MSRTTTRAWLPCVLFGLTALLLPSRARSQSTCAGAPGAVHIDRRALRSLQRWVNQGHEPWRLESWAVASHKLYEIFWPGRPGDTTALPLRQLYRSPEAVAYAYNAGAFEWIVILARPPWLLPLAKKWQWEVWAVTSITCGGSARRSPPIRVPPLVKFGTQRRTTGPPRAG